MFKLNIFKSIIVVATILISVHACDGIQNQEEKSEFIFDATLFSIGDTLYNLPGTIYEILNEPRNLYLIKVGSNRYPLLPDTFPKYYRIDGLRVKFTCVMKSTSQYARLIGRPIKLLEIKKEDG